MNASHRTLLAGAFGAPPCDAVDTDSAAVNVTVMSLHGSLTKSMDAAFESNEYTSMADVSLSPPKRRNSRTMRIESPTSVTAFFMDGESLPSIPLSDDEWMEESSVVLPPAKKQVRFEEDEAGDIVEDISLKSFPKYQLTPADIDKLWWTKFERRDLKNSVPELCRDLMRYLPQYRRAAMKLCALASRRDYFNLLDSNVESTVSALELLTADGARGLERPLFYRMALPRKSSKSHVYAVLRTQQLIRDLEGEDVYNQDEKADLIADQYRENSQFAVRFAQILGVADEMEARRKDLVVC